MVAKIKDAHGHQYVVREVNGYMQLISAKGTILMTNSDYMQMLSNREVFPIESNW